MALTSRQEPERPLASRSNQFWGRPTKPATAERVRNLCGQVARE